MMYRFSFEFMHPIYCVLKLVVLGVLIFPALGLIEKLDAFIRHEDTHKKVGELKKNVSDAALPHLNRVKSQVEVHVKKLTEKTASKSDLKK